MTDGRGGIGEVGEVGNKRQNDHCLGFVKRISRGATWQKAFDLRIIQKLCVTCNAWSFYVAVAESF